MLSAENTEKFVKQKSLNDLIKVKIQNNFLTEIMFLKKFTFFLVQTGNKFFIVVNILLITMKNVHGVL